MIKKPILEENEKVQKQIEIARATEGFSHLTEKQQQIIKLSLYMQARGERYDTDENENILKVNKKSTQYVADKNCHTSILNLENEDMTKAPGDVRTTVLELKVD